MIRAALLVLLLLAQGVSAHAEAGGEPGSGGEAEPLPESLPFQVPRGERPCPFDAPGDWRDAQVVEGVPVAESRQCLPDDPRAVAAFVKGTNNMPRDVLDELGLHPDAVVKEDDLDGDGDFDRITITLEVIELNGWHLPDDAISSDGYAIAPGVEPSFWVFAPKTQRFHGGPVEQFWRMPSAALRIEQGDQVTLRLENTHYMPHTVHLHGVDHQFVDAEGNGNDGVPHFSENPVAPGEVRTYEITPRQPGTMFYHCHVQPQVHVMMGLNGFLTVEEARPNNPVQTINIGAGEVRHPSVAVREDYDREFDLHYQDVDKELAAMPASHHDPRVVSQRMHEEYDITEKTSDYFLLNGKSFPYTLRESLLPVGPNETIKLRVLNGGAEPVSLHTHGHKPTVTHYDGVPGPEVQRDVFTLTAAQRLDLRLDTTDDGLNSYGPGAWFVHDHQEQAVTTDGIGPGGDISIIVYPGYQDEDMMPRTLGHGMDLWFTPEYYRGELPVFGPTGLDFLQSRAEQPSSDGEDAPVPLWLLPAALVAALAWRRP